MLYVQQRNTQLFSKEQKAITTQRQAFIIEHLIQNTE